MDPVFVLGRLPSAWKRAEPADMHRRGKRTLRWIQARRPDESYQGLLLGQPFDVGTDRHHLHPC
jgi:hypothetical protein